MLPCFGDALKSQKKLKIQGSGEVLAERPN